MKTRTAARGTFDQCLAHFIDVCKGGYTTPSLFLSEERNFARWVEGRSKPIGDNKVRMRVYLQDLGYTITDVEGQSKVIAVAAEVLACRFATVSELAYGFGFQGKERINKMLRILHGNRRARPRDLHTGEAFLAQFDESVRAARKARVSSSVSVAAVPRIVGGETLDKAGMLVACASFIMGMLPITDYLLSDACTAGDREKLRLLTGGDGLFNLSTNFNRLCSETERRETPSR